MGILDKLKSLFGGGAEEAKEKVETVIEDGTAVAKEAVEKGTAAVRETVDTAIEKGTVAAGEAIQKGAAAASEAIEKGAGAANEAIDVAEKMTEHAAGAARNAVASASEAATAAASRAASVAGGAKAAFVSGSSNSGGTTKVEITVNGKKTAAEIEDRMLLSAYIRDKRNLTGTHIGCDTSQCGACVVHVDGKAVKACTMLAVQAAGSEVTTIEGLASDGELHPMQAAFRDNHGLQCGFCTPGMIMTAVDIVNREGAGVDEQTIREQLEGNICRCTGYHNIVKSIAAGAKEMGSDMQEAAE